MTANARTTLRERPGSAVRLRDTISTMESDIPADMTIGEYRRSRTAPGRRRNLLRGRR
jgi:hypothetical protein